ncbi:MAG: FG-GAP-like repeat-containing protein [bacterium]
MSDRNVIARRAATLIHILLLSACGPGLTAISPQAAPVGALVTITGSGFGGNQGSSQVFFAGVSAGVAASWSSSSITIVVPVGATTGPVTVEVGAATSIAKPFIVSSPRANGLRIGTYLPPYQLSLSSSAQRSMDRDDRAHSPQDATLTSQHGVVTGDWNEDGLPDLAHGVSNDVCVRLGVGDGRFSAGVCTDLGIPGAGTGGLSLGDFDEDSHGDLVASVKTRLALLRGDGHGGFLAPIYSAEVTNVSQLVTADFDLDQHLDVAALGGSVVHVFGGDGQGGFELLVSVPIPPYAQAIGAADLDGDGYPEIVMTNGAPAVGQMGSLSVLRNDTQGGFVSAPSISTDSAPEGFVLEDVDRDGDADVALVHDEYFASTNDLTVFENDGTGSFVRSFDLPMSDHMIGLNSTDLNGDGIVDLVAGGSDRTYTFLGYGDGTFLQWDASYRDYAGGFAIADFNLDGRADVWSWGTYGSPVILGDGSGGLASATFLQLTWLYGALKDVIPTDLNEDGKVDLVVDVATNDPGYEMAILLNDGAGGFTQTWIPVTGSEGLQHLASEDVNGDGHVDIVRNAWTGTSYALEAFLGDGHGGFSAPARTSLNLTTGLSNIVAGNLNGDGKDDVVVSFGPYLQLWLSNGDGTFGSPAVLENVYADEFALSVARVNGDDFDDIVFKVSSYPPFDGDIRVYLGDGLGGFVLSDRIPADGGPLGVADLNQDGIPDLLDSDDHVLHVPASHRSWFGVGDGTFVGPTVSPYLGVPAGISDFDGDGWPDVVGDYSTGIRIAFGDGSGAFTPSEDRYARSDGLSRIADINDDGHMDLVEWTYWGYLAFYFGDGHGNFVDYD